MNKENEENKDKFTLKLDKLFGILNCKCLIYDCKEFGCKVIYKQQAHKTCNCSKKYKIPIIDIFFALKLKEINIVPKDCIKYLPKLCTNTTDKLQQYTIIVIKKLIREKWKTAQLKVKLKTRMFQ